MKKKKKLNGKCEVKEIARKTVEYQGIKIREKEVLLILKAAGYKPKILRRIKRELHMTCKYHPQINEIYTNEQLGKEVQLRVVALGELWRNGRLENIGLKIADDAHLSANEIAHVTCWISKHGKARNTGKCDWFLPLDLTINGRFAVFNDSDEWAYKTA